jgi:iron-sulfur cluster repair protein YtfE (RIC family)
MALQASSARIPAPVLALENDHLAIWERIRKLRIELRKSGPAITLPAFHALDRALRSHFDVEENIVFPMLVGMTQHAAEGAVSLLREEHDEARQRLLRLGSAIAEEHSPVLELDGLVHLLSRHRTREEQLVYPLVAEFCPAPILRELANRDDDPTFWGV